MAKLREKDEGEEGGGGERRKTYGDAHFEGLPILPTFLSHSFGIIIKVGSFYGVNLLLTRGDEEGEYLFDLNSRRAAVQLFEMRAKGKLLRCLFVFN